MLDVKIFINSAIEDILAFKCCNLPDQNLEFHVINKGEKSASIKNYFILENERESITVHTIYPPWKQIIEPGSAVAYYCSFDLSEWERYDTFVIEDMNGKYFRFPLKE